MSMQLNRDNSPLWMIEFDKQLLRGKHVLLYGNVEDRFLLPVSGEVVSLSEFLNRYFCEAGYELVGHYDIVDGIQLADPQEMGPLLDALANPRATPPSTTSQHRPESEPTTSRQDPPSQPDQRNEQQSEQLTLQRQQTARRTPGRGSDGHDRPRSNRQTDSRFVPPGSALPVIRRVLRQPHTPSAMMLEFTDKLVSDPQLE